MRRLRDFVGLYRIYRNHYHCLRTARYRLGGVGRTDSQKGLI